MPSPFPGMDPWLEGSGRFRDLHLSLTYLLREALNAALPAGYRAQGTQLVWVDDTVTREPDVGVFGPDQPPNRGEVDRLPGLVAVAVPVAEPEEQPYLEIVTDQGERLVTAVEILSPSNKRPGAGRQAYQAKQKELRLGGVNLVEIDLLRAGRHTTAVSRDRLRRARGRFDYHVSVTVAQNQRNHFAAPLRLADRLPAFGIPLDPGVAPVVVDLQPLLDRAYDTGRYAQATDYRRDPDPPLAPEQKAWADAILTEKGLLPAAGGPT